MADFFIYFGQVMLYTIGALIGSGILIYIIDFFYTALICESIGYKYLILSSYIGTPVHELGHALMCLIFGHKIDDIKFYNKNDEDKTLGYVKHSYNSKNFYQQVGNFFIGLGPIFSGFLVITLVLVLFFREPTFAFFDSSFQKILSGEPLLDIVLNSFSLISTLLFSETHIAIKIISLIIILSVSLHVNLSLQDIKNSIIGFMFYLIVGLTFSAVTFFIGEGLCNLVLEYLLKFFLISCSLFSIIIVFALINLAIAIVMFILKKFFER
ncbi:MAG: M50 family metallopeptidase [Clostridia bacterium]|nr:M50 family metallopeptidase [Clostridia bacterium]